MMVPFSFRRPPIAASTATVKTPLGDGAQHLKGLGILQRSGGRGDPSAAGRGKFLLTVSVNKTRRASQTILERSDREESRLREGKIPVEPLGQGVRLRAERMQLIERLMILSERNFMAATLPRTVTVGCKGHDALGHRLGLIVAGRTSAKAHQAAF